MDKWIGKYLGSLLERQLGRKVGRQGKGNHLDEGGLIHIPHFCSCIVISWVGKGGWRDWLYIPYVSKGCCKLVDMKVLHFLQPMLQN